ncbi:BPSL0761 family protein [Pseudomonas sp. RIT-To-2]|uniref:BPSL0761 family protein n=1 Tax=Pseudomonas sp. RIT-To-2 TaxID=3462541 RepID=UPI00241394C2
MPVQRTKTVVATRRFLHNLMCDERVPLDVRDQACALLKHYPTARNVLTIAKREAYLQSAVGISDILFSVGDSADEQALNRLVEQDEQIGSN